MTIIINALFKSWTIVFNHATSAKSTFLRLFRMGYIRSKYEFMERDERMSWSFLYIQSFAYP